MKQESLFNTGQRVRSLLSRNKFLSVLIVGFVARFILAPYFTFPDMKGFELFVDLVFIGGFNSVSWSTTWGPGFYLFYFPIYVPYMVFNYFGLYHEFLLNFLFKIPPILGDFVVFYSLYNIASLLLKDDMKSLSIAAMYFLNPLVIQQSAINGQFESLVAAFMMLSLLYLIKGKTNYSAICLAIGASIRFVPILILPVCLIYVYRIGRTRPWRYLGTFLISIAVLFVPLFIVVAQIYMASPSALTFSLKHHWLGMASQERFHAMEMEKVRGLFGFIARLGFWSTLSQLVQGNVFLSLFTPFYVGITVLSLRSRLRPRTLLILYSMIALSLFTVVRPLSFISFLIWILPFILLSTHVFFDLPRYFFHVIWVSALVSDYLFANPTWYLAGTLPGAILPYWPINTRLAYPLTIVTPLFLILIILVCSSYIVASHKIARARETLLWFVQSGFLTTRNTKFILFFSAFNLFETIRVSFYHDSPLFVASVLAGGLNILILWDLLYKNRSTIRNYPRFFHNNTSKALALIYVGSLVAIPFSFVRFEGKYSTFLFVQILFVSALWLTNRRFATSLEIQRISFIFTMIYALTFLYTPTFNLQNNLSSLVILLYVVSWLLIGVFIERRS